jgi:GDP-L-fucose synthase
MPAGHDTLAGERVLVTGSGGVLGTALVRLLRSVPTGALRALRRSDCDLLDGHAVAGLWRSWRPTLVFHLAGRVAGIAGNLSFAGQAFTENVRINLNVVEASHRCGARKLVAAGSTAVYPDTAPRPMREADLWAGPPHASEAAYGHAKRALLAQLEAYQQQYGLAFAYLICTNLYGPGDRFDERYGHVVPSLVKRFYEATAQGRPAVTVWGDGSPTRDFLHADDAARGFLVAALRGAGALNLATGAAVTVRALVEALTLVSGYPGEVGWDTARPNGQQVRDYDVSRLHELGWRAEIPLVEGLRRTYDWYAANHPSARH